MRLYLTAARRVNIGLTILLVAGLASIYQGYNVNRRADRIAATVADLSDATKSLAHTVEQLNGRVLDCVDEGGACKTANDQATAAAVANIVDTLHTDLDATLAQLENDLEKLRQDRQIVPTPLPPVVVTIPTPRPAPPAQVVMVPQAPGICLPLGVVTVGCSP